ncbi:hypothetical protein ABK040_013702 [Willaertia magna]
MIQRFFIYSLLALCFVLLTDYILSCGGHQHVQPKLKASFTVPTKFSWVKRETHSLAGTPISIPKQWKALHQFSQEKLLEVFYQVHSIASNTDDKKAEMIQPRIQHFDKTIKLLTSNDYFSNEFYLKHEITFTIALKQKNINKLKEKFETVSDPFHEDYTNYLTMKEIKNLIEPTKETIQTVLTWLKNYNDISVEKISKHNDFIVVKSTIETINQLFNIKLVPFIHQNNVLYGVVFRSESASYSLPDYLVHHIDFVSDLVKFPSEQLLWKKSVPPRNPQVMVTPSFLINKYNIQLPVGPSTKNRQSCAQFLDQYYSPSDLNLFFNQFNVLNGSKTPLRVIGPNNPNQPGVEASLDIQYLMGVAQNIPTDFISTGGRVNNGQEPFIDWAITVQQQGDDGAYTHSISYGDVESTIPRDYAERMNNELIKLAVSGRSVLFATGDDGVQCNAAGTRQEPNFPAGSPYVLSVGATEPYGEGEKSTSWSGGGFSNYFARGAFQQDAVSAYLRGNNLPPTSYFNATGRGYPDVAAYGVNFSVIVGGLSRPVGGTSAAAPTFAAVISLLNEWRIRNNMKPLGYLNKWMYSVVAKTSGALNDVTVGSNNTPPCPGFQCAQGWDPVTGLGTPNMRVLLQLALQK